MDERTAQEVQLDGGPHGRAAHTIAKPYVVSLDLIPLLRRWAARRGFVMPSGDFFELLRDEMRVQLTSMFDTVEILDEHAIRPELLATARSAELPIVSLDYAYCPIGVPFDITRAVHPDKMSAGLTHRGGSAPIETQLREIASQIQGDIILVDDVIFSGKMLAEDVIPMLGARGVTVRTIVAGIGIGEGVARVRELVADVRCVHTYERVIDEICERDFYPGVPLSGRTVLGAENYGMPYMLPFGDPQEWASIPASHAKPFSAFCIGQSIKLFGEFERLSGKSVRMCDLARSVHSLPVGDERFIDQLSAAISRI